jgi:dihydrofolate reductase
MIRFIAAIDSKRGIANDHGIPWQGKVPSDPKYLREHTSVSDVIMGFGMYKEVDELWSEGVNYVAAEGVDEQPREGFEFVTDARTVVENAKGDLWVLGGAMLFASTLDLADELYITQLDQDFHCTKFFPEFKDAFKLQSESEPITENGITLTFQVWVRK